MLNLSKAQKLECIDRALIAIEVLKEDAKGFVQEYMNSPEDDAEIWTKANRYLDEYYTRVHFLRLCRQQIENENG